MWLPAPVPVPVHAAWFPVLVAWLLDPASTSSRVTAPVPVTFSFSAGPGPRTSSPATS